MAPKKNAWKQIIHNVEKEKFKLYKHVCMLREPVHCGEEKFEIGENQRFFTLTCTLKCSVSLHNSCWRLLKEYYDIKTDKEGFDYPCITPDCKGLIHSIHVVKEKGEVVEVKRHEASGYHHHHDGDANNNASGKFTSPGPNGACGGGGQPHRRATSECESGAEAGSKSASGSSNDLAIKVRELQRKSFAQSNEIRESKIKEEKLIKEIEKLRNEKSKLLSQTLQADNSSLEVCAKTAYENSHLQQQLDACRSHANTLASENQRLTNDLIRTRNFCESLQKEMLKLRGKEDELNLHLETCGHRDQVLESELLAIKTKLLNCQVERSTDKAFSELFFSFSFIKAINFFISRFDSKGFGEWTVSNGGWATLKAQLELLKQEYEDYKKNLVDFVDECESKQRGIMTQLRTTGKSTDFALTFTMERPKLVADASVVESLLTLFYVDKDVMNGGDAKSPDLVDPRHSERYVGHLMQAFPLLSYEEARSHVGNILSVYGGDPKELEVSKMIRYVGRHLLEKKAEAEATMSMLSGAKWIAKPSPNLVAAFSMLPNRDSFENCEECSICIDLMTASEEKKLKCGHKFHADCINLWLKEKRDCPICRNYTIQDEEFPAVNVSSMEN